MLFGQSVFQSVVARLEREAEDMPPAEEPHSGFSIKSFSSSLVFETAIQNPSSTNQPLDSYLGFLEEPTIPPAPEPEKMPSYLERVSLSDVSEELAISENDTLETLGEKRRAFARLNHPDTVSPQFRENANKRMTSANLLIDQAIRFL